MPKGKRLKNGLPTRIPVNITSDTERVINNIFHVACKTLEVDFNKVVEKDRRKKYSEARYIITHIIRSRFGSEVPYIYISKKFNRETHNCAFGAELTCRDLLLNNKYFREKYNRVIEKCHG